MTTSRTVPAALFAIAALLALTLGAPSQAAYPGANGRIAFYTDVDDPGNILEIYSMRSDGTDQQRLTTDMSGAKNPAWSPNGDMIAFDNFAAPDFYTDVYSMDPDGGGIVRVTDASADGPGSGDSNPSWSPDGTQLAFEGIRNGDIDIFVINLDGTGRTNLTNNPGQDGNPAWSPDGDKIAFTALGNGNLDIFVMDADGSNRQNLTAQLGTDTEPAWSPDGSQIAYASSGDIYIMNADGTGKTKVTTDPGIDRNPAWSPDGTMIAFVSDRDGNPNIYTIDIDGSNEMRVTDDPVEEWAPDWQPLPAPAKGDVDCDGDIDSADALKNLQHVAGLSVNQEPGCPQIGSEFASIFGDIDCDDDVDSVDALLILRHLAALLVNIPKDCTAIGT